MGFYVDNGQGSPNNSGERGLTGAKGHRIVYTLLWDPRHLFGTFSIIPLAGNAFVTINKHISLRIIYCLFIHFA